MMLPLVVGKAKSAIRKPIAEIEFVNTVSPSGHLVDLYAQLCQATMPYCTAEMTREIMRISAK